MENRIEELEQKLDSCKQFIDYLLRQTKDAESKTQHELWHVVSDLEYEAQQLLVEEF